MSLAVALSALLFNVTLPAEIAGELEGYSFVRKSVSKLLSSGTLWATLSVYAGWRIRRPVLSSVAGVLVAEGSLLVHYVLGMALGIYDMHELEYNYTWFITGVVFCAPLGWCGWIASTPGWGGLAARLLVPAGAILEPFVTDKFTSPPISIPWPERLSDAVCGGLLIFFGAALGLLVLRRGRSGFTAPSPPPS